MRDLGMWYLPSLMSTAGTGIPSPSVPMKALLENNFSMTVSPGFRHSAFIRWEMLPQDDGPAMARF